MEKENCAICGFDKGIQNHHIIKRRIGGTNDLENLVPLCPNHHWIADFGTDEEKIEILNKIKEITGKCGKEITSNEKNLLDIKIKALQEEIFGIFDEKEWTEFKKTSNYLMTLSFLLGRGCPQVYSSKLHRRAEILLIIKKLNTELEDLR